MALDTTPEIGRHLEFATVFNFRDMGGYPAADGRTVRWRRIFRADAVHRLVGADLVPLGIRTVVDLRTAHELEERGRFDHEDVDFHHLPVLKSLWEHTGRVPGQEADPVTFLADRYLEMLAEGPEAIATVLRLLGDERATPLVFHCAAGKDRTGVVAAFTLSLLGVADHDVVADYALSGRATERFIAWIKEEYPERAAAIDAEPTAYLQSPAPAMARFLSDVVERWGSMAACAEEVLGIGPDDVDALRRNLLV